MLRRYKLSLVNSFSEDKLILFQKVYDFLVYFYPVINRIPKSHRLVLGKTLEEIGIDLLLLIIEANKANGEERKSLQKIISDKVDSLRILIRLTKDLRFMSIQQYSFTVEKINEIGKMLNGWMKSV